MPFSPNPLFVGRVKELRQLATLLKGDSTVAINQPATTTGLGKTQRATAFVRHYGHYFAGVHWLTLADPTAIAFVNAAPASPPSAAATDSSRPTVPAPPASWALPVLDKEGHRC